MFASWVRLETALARDLLAAVILSSPLAMVRLVLFFPLAAAHWDRSFTIEPFVWRLSLPLPPRLILPILPARIPTHLPSALTLSLRLSASLVV